MPHPFAQRFFGRAGEGPGEPQSAARVLEQAFREAAALRALGADMVDLFNAARALPFALFTDCELHAVLDRKTGVL
ncbi:hypothetical protein [Rhodovulum steppense]|uniref:hypothetical protein n=1 Tax=Rhodovulum steppense TaxID=540251 RepID=UPI001047795E|nr:hypothetical protein [Rhodovulum steppense]